MKNCFELPESDDVVDLGRYLDRAKRIDPTGAVRLRAYGDVLTVYVAPIFAGDYIEDAPLFLGLRTLQLAHSTEFDVTVRISDLAAELQRIIKGDLQEESMSLSERLARLTGKQTASTNKVCLEMELISVPWSNETPTRTGWVFGGELEESELTEVARKGMAEVAEALPTAVGGPIAARVRSDIWSRAIDVKYPVPTGAAFIAAGLGFLSEGEKVNWYVSGDWVRLSSEHGHVLAKFARDYVSTD